MNYFTNEIRVKRLKFYKFLVNLICISFVQSRFRIQNSLKQETMRNTPGEDEFNAVLDSARAKQKRLVDPQLDNNQMDQNIIIKQLSEPKILNSEHVEKRQNSLPLTGQSYDLNKAAHPTVCIFTFAFKVAAFVIYLLIGNFISSILTFIFVLVLSSIDFWFVKNISGRILVGLRWRNTYDSNGKEIWHFQSYDHQFKSNSVDRMFFWASQLLFTALWGIFLLLNILTLDFFWALLLLITAGLSGVNLYGYYQCRGQHKKKVEGIQKEYGKKVLQSFAQRIL